MKNVQFAIFGDCVSQGIVNNREHTRAIGFTNWCSLVSEPIQDEKIINMVGNIAMSPYSIRNLELDLNKRSLDYLLEEKASYLLLDPNDCRMELVEVGEPENHKLYTFSMAGGGIIQNTYR